MAPGSGKIDMHFNTIEEAVEDYKKGKIVILVDDEDRENSKPISPPSKPKWPTPTSSPYPTRRNNSRPTRKQKTT